MSRSIRYDVPSGDRKDLVDISKAKNLGPTPPPKRRTNMSIKRVDFEFAAGVKDFPEEFIEWLRHPSKRVQLTGKTKKGKDRIRTYGRVWIVQPNSNRPGSLLLKSVDGNDLRWVKIIDDPNFNIMFQFRI